jgi:hypothetical protein
MDSPIERGIATLNGAFLCAAGRSGMRPQRRARWIARLPASSAFPAAARWRGEGGIIS